MKKSQEVYLFHQGTYYHSYNFLGCHPENGGAWFRVWAPNAIEISVVGDFNGWDKNCHKLSKIEDSSIWEVFVEKVENYQNYKYCILAKDNIERWKADLYGGIAQLGERLPCKQEASGSIPLISTNQHIEN